MKRWKKFLAGVLAMAMMLSCLPSLGLEAKAAGSGTQVFGDFEYVIHADVVGINKYTGKGGDVVIPSEIDGKLSVNSAKTAKGKKLTVKWAKDQMASGYQVQISTDEKFKKNVKSKSLSKTSYTFKNLETGKKYYVRIRSYKKSGKETLYSAWSKAKVSGKIQK